MEYEKPRFRETLNAPEHNMKLGKVVQINVGVSDLEKSLAFYEQLGFQKMEDSMEPYPWARLTDGQNLVLLNQDGNIYIGLVYFSKDAARRIAKIEGKGVEFIQRREQDGKLFMGIFVGPGGLVTGLVNHDPAGITLPPGFPKTKCGTFGEFATSVDDYEAAAEFWRNLGFTVLHESGEPYPWGILGDEMIVLGLHQAGDSSSEFAFSGPALTYFAGDMADRIAELKLEGIGFASEMADENGQVNNATLHGPDGELFFLFHGEI
jgi:catechol 2,3-dioxygenase-like lactoylglutathione lyase family enzyme